MPPKKQAAAKKSTSRQTARKTSGTQAPAKKTAAKKATAKKTAAKKTAAKKTAPKKTAAKKTAAKKTPPKKTAAKKKTPAKKAPSAKKPAAAKKSSTAKKASKKASKTASPKTAARKGSAASRARKSRSKGKDTPAIFRVKGKKAGATAFTLEDVRSFLASRKDEKGSTRTATAGKSAANRTDKADTAKRVEVVDAPPQEKRNLGTASLDDILGTGPAASPASQAEDKGIDRVPKKWLKYYKLLVALRDEVREELDFHTQETLRRSSKEDSGDLSSYGQHQADAGTETFDRDFALSLVSSEQDALYEIEEAIGRIFDGTYGVCEVTGQPISKERLTAVPFARFSVEGQAEHERNQRRRVERGGVFAEGEDAPQIPDTEDE